MGSKMLKAIALTGISKPDVKVARPDEFDKVVKESFKVLATHPLSRAFRDLGSSFTLSVVQKAGILPTRNFQEGVFEGSENMCQW